MSAKQEEFQRNAIGESGAFEIKTRQDLDAKTGLLANRFRLAELNVSQLRSQKNTNPNTLAEAVNSANVTGHNFVMAETYLKLADVSNAVHSDPQSDPDIRTTANPEGYRKVA